MHHVPMFPVSNCHWAPFTPKRPDPALPLPTIPAGQFMGEDELPRGSWHMPK